MNTQVLPPIVKQYDHDPVLRQRILHFLYGVEQDFYPPITSYSSLEDYVTDKLSKVLYIEQEFQIVGYLRFYYHHDLYQAPYIRNIGVHRQYRGQGYGKMLLTNCLQLLKEAKHSRALLRTWQTNRIGINLYQQMNFQLKEVLKNDRGSDMDTFVFEVAL